MSNTDGSSAHAMPWLPKLLTAAVTTGLEAQLPRVWKRLAKGASRRRGALSIMKCANRDGASWAARQQGTNILQFA